ncbi:MAG: hypothetical protein WC789_14490 [Lentisphaeria bacterium]
MMKALTIHQPYAGLVALGHKPEENRGRRPPQSIIGVRSAIHAGLVTDLLPDGLWTGPLPDLCAVTGAVVGTGVVCGWVEVNEWTDGPYIADYYGVSGAEAIKHMRSKWRIRGHRVLWIYRDCIPLPSPVPCPGQQMLGWTLPPGVEAAVRGQLSRGAA